MVRDALPSDIPHMLRLIEQFAAEVPYHLGTVDRGQATAVLEAYVEASTDLAFCQIAEYRGDVYGLLIGERSLDIWTGTPKSVEVVFYVRPERRGQPGAGKLLLAFSEWAEQVPGIVRIEGSSGIADRHAAALYARLGYEPRGALYGTEAS